MQSMSLRAVCANVVCWHYRILNRFTNSRRELMRYCRRSWCMQIDFGRRAFRATLVSKEHAFWEFGSRFVI